MRYFCRKQKRVSIMDVKRKWKVVSLSMLLLIILCLGSIYISKHFLTVTHYEISGKNLKNKLRILQITDLHNSEFGQNNIRLIKSVREQHPDLIFLTGDILNSHKADPDISLNLVRELVDIAPVYATYGNHEKDYERNYGVNLAVEYESVGATLLEYDYEEIVVKNQKLRIGGLYGYCTPAKYLETGEAKLEECAYLEKLQSTSDYTILLTHMPYAWIMNDGISEWNIDCVFTGHDHGGLIRIPFVGGLYAPDQGWFPGKDCGLYYSQDGEKVMVLSRGLGRSGKLPRFNNVPEIVVVDLLPTK